MLNERELSAAIGSTAYGTNGDKIGTVESFFLDDRTRTATWVAVSTGLFGSRHSVVPAVDAAFDEGALRLPVTSAAVKAAPRMAGDHLDPVEEAALREHYGIAPVAVPLPPVPAAPVPPQPPVPPVPPATPVITGRHRRSDDETVDEGLEGDEGDADGGTGGGDGGSDGGMTRSEERLRVGTERVAATRVRLVKHVVTEEVQITVPIRREEIRVEEVPLDGTPPVDGESLVPAGEPGLSSAPAGGLPEEIVLHTERPVVTVEVVPTERVRLRTELVQGQETVTGQVQREQIVVDETLGPPVAG